jgi:creatinine amidohydrolase
MVTFFVKQESKRPIEYQNEYVAVRRNYKFIERAILYLIVIIALGASVEGLKAQAISQLTTLEVERYVKSRGDIVPIVIPVGATEQHGPTGLIGTDIQTARAVAFEVCEACDVILGPEIPVGMSIHHCGFAGSAALRPTTFANVVCDIVWSLHESSNFTHFFFINGHGGNVMPMKLAFDILRAQDHSPWHTTKYKLLQNVSGVEVNTTSIECDQPKEHATQDVRAIAAEELSRPKFQLEMISWYDNPDSQALAKSLYGDELGQHATPDEVSITRYLYPDVTPDAELRPENILRNLTGRVARSSEVDAESILSQMVQGVSDPAVKEKVLSMGRFATSFMDPADFRRRFPDGRLVLLLVLVLLTHVGL